MTCLASKPFYVTKLLIGRSSATRAAQVLVAEFARIRAAWGDKGLSSGELSCAGSTYKTVTCNQSPVTCFALSPVPCYLFPPSVHPAGLPTNGLDAFSAPIVVGGPCPESTTAS